MALASLCTLQEPFWCARRLPRSKVLVMLLRKLLLRVVMLCLGLSWSTTTKGSCVHDQLSARLVSSTQTYNNDPRQPHDAQHAPSPSSPSTQEQPIIVE
jgi:hypothetical protein